METDEKKGATEPHTDESHQQSAGIQNLGPEEISEKRSGAEESIASPAGAVNKASRAMKKTAQKYLDIAGIKVDVDDVEKRVRDQPFFCLGLAAGAGFIIGGGLATSLGVALLGLFGRKAAAETATNFGQEVLQEAISGTESSA
jgi:ElaB/YqjD/DUF883 family membrane-anchored ribosome-binding protein